MNAGNQIQDVENLQGQTDVVLKLMCHKRGLNQNLNYSINC